MLSLLVLAGIVDDGGAESGIGVASRLNRRLPTSRIEFVQSSELVRRLILCFALAYICSTVTFIH